MDIKDSHKFAEVIFKNIREGVVILDRNFRILDANESMVKWTGKSAAGIINRDCREVFHEADEISPYGPAQQVFATGQIVTMTRKDDHRETATYAELSAYPIKDESGDIMSCVVFIQDITERMLCHDEVLRLYNEVAQTKEYLEGIIEHSADAIVTSDLNGIITSWNEGAERIYGFTKEEAIGKYLPFVRISHGSRVGKQQEDQEWRCVEEG
jgi:PAS domain S-box-containing protein